MDGTCALVAALLADDGVTALVPSARIMGGVLPQNTPLPAISVTRVSVVLRRTLTRQGKTHVVERVQATVLAETPDAQSEIQKAMLRLHAASPEVDGIESVKIHHESGGPDFMNEDASIYLGSEDFRVTYNEVI